VLLGLAAAGHRRRRPPVRPDEAGPVLALVDADARDLPLRAGALSAQERASRMPPSRTERNRRADGARAAVAGSTRDALGHGSQLSRSSPAEDSARRRRRATARLSARSGLAALPLARAAPEQGVRRADAREGDRGRHPRRRTSAVRLDVARVLLPLSSWRAPPELAPSVAVVAAGRSRRSPTAVAPRATGARTASRDVPRGGSATSSTPRRRSSPGASRPDALDWRAHLALTRVSGRWSRATTAPADHGGAPAALSRSLAPRPLEHGRTR